MMNNDEMIVVQKFMEKYQQMIYRVAFSNLKNTYDAEDIVQETMIRYIRSKPVFCNETHEKAWFLRTAINLCHDYHKDSWNKRTVNMEEAMQQAPEAFAFPFPVPWEDETLQFVLSLPFLYRIPIYLFYYEDYSIKEIAVILKEKEATIKTRLKRGREQLKKKISQSGEG